MSDAVAVCIRPAVSNGRCGVWSIGCAPSIPGGRASAAWPLLTGGSRELRVDSGLQPHAPPRQPSRCREGRRDGGPIEGSGGFPDQRARAAAARPCPPRHLSVHHDVSLRRRALSQASECRMGVEADPHLPGCGICGSLLQKNQGAVQGSYLHPVAGGPASCWVRILLSSVSPLKMTAPAPPISTPSVADPSMKMVWSAGGS